MKFRSPVYSEVSGSIGGLTYAHNKGGMYTRARRTPVNPDSVRQVTARAALQDTSQAWSGVLTQAQRDGWSNYATNTPLSNAFGDPLQLSGQQMYVRCNSIRISSGLARVDAPPAVPGEAQLSALTITDPGPDIGIAYDNSDAWATNTGGALIIQTSRAVSAGISFLKSPLRFLDVVLGDDTTPPTSPVSEADNAFGQTLTGFSGAKQFVVCRATQADGRLSPIQRLSFTVA